MKVTPKVRAFVEHYLADGNATAAARKAGYKGSAHTLEVQGSQLLRKPEVRALIEAGQQKASGERIATAVEVREYLTGTMRDYRETTDNRIKAAALLAKTLGLFVEKRASLHVHIRDPIDDLTVDELRALAARPAEVAVQ